MDLPKLAIFYLELKLNCRGSFDNFLVEDKTLVLTNENSINVDDVLKDNESMIEFDEGS